MAGFPAHWAGPAAALSAVLLAGMLGSCGLDSTGRQAIPSDRQETLASIAEKSSRLSELERQAYTRNTLLQFSAAEQDYRETLTLARELFPTDPARASDLRLHLALNKSNLGQFESAESLFDRSREIVAELGLPSEQAKPDLFYAQHQMNMKQFVRAEEIAQRAEATLDELIARRVGGEGGGLEHLELVRRDDGALLLDQTHANVANARITRDTDVEGDRTQLSDLDRLKLQRVHARYIMARAMMARRASEGLDQLIREAEADLAEVPESFGRWLRAEIASLRAERLTQQDRKQKAIVELTRAIDLLRRYEAGSRPEALLLFRVGELLIATGRGREGADAYRRALEILREDSQGIEVSQAGLVIEKLLGDVQAGIPEAPDQLFQLMQKVRSSATAQTVAQLSARLASGDDERARSIRELQDLEREQNVLSARFDRLEGDPNADLHYKRVTESKLEQVRRDITARRARMADIAPNYDQLIEASIPLADAQAALADGEVMAVIQLGVEKGLVAVLTNLAFYAYEIPLGLAAAEQIVRALREPMDGEFLVAFDLRRSHDLYRTLFAPVASTIDRANHLIIVPTGPLLSLPFNVLVTEPHEAEIEIVGTDPYNAYFDYSKVAWLGRQAGITTGVSISSFFLGRKTPDSAAPNAFRGFGDFRRFGDDPAVVAQIVRDHGLPDSCNVPVRALGLLNELGGTAEELRKIGEILNSPAADIVLGQEFNDTAVKEMDLSKFRVLHFATHGLLAQDPQCLPEPGLVTSLGARGDGLLEASEIVELDLDAELVVMSACDTGAGAGQAATELIGFRGAGGSYAAGGESLNGLARSFFFAGARNVMSTHWSVDDRSTQELVSEFYRAAARDEISTAEALRISEEKLIAGGELSHPFFWAPFAIIGDGARKLNIGDGPVAATSAEQTPSKI